MPRSSASSSTPSPNPPCSTPSRIPAQINEELVDAYLARRALDYLVGFTLSPVLWRKLPGARSAGRVQSVALRLVCEREDGDRSVQAAGILDRRSGSRAPAAGGFTAHLTHLDGKKLDKLSLGNEARSATRAVAAIKRRQFSRRLHREQAGQAPPCPAVHHLDAAAGSLAQARLRGQAHHADRAAALRRRRYRRRNGRPHHLYAYRRRHDGGRRRSPKRAR